MSLRSFREAEVSDMRLTHRPRTSHASVLGKRLGDSAGREGVGIWLESGMAGRYSVALSCYLVMEHEVVALYSSNSR